jgi:hypothetical protein
MGTNINTRKFLSRRYSGIYILTGVSYNPDYLLVKNAIESTGVTLTSTQNTAGNTLVNQLQSYNLWTKLKAIYGILGGTAGAHKWNWKNPLDTNAAYRLTFSTGWTHSSTGMTPNGTSAYANTNLTPSTSLSQNSLHHSFYSRTNSDNTGADMGCNYTSGNTSLITMSLRNSNTFYSRLNDDTTQLSYSNTNSQGFYINTRTTSTGYSSFKNNVKNSITVNSSGNQTNVFYLGAVAVLGNNYWSNRQCAFASIGDGLTDTEAANFYTAVQNYNTTLGRQV